MSGWSRSKVTKSGAVMEPTDGVGLRDDVGRARLAIDRRQLAEALPGMQLPERHLAPRLGEDGDLELAG